MHKPLDQLIRHFRFGPIKKNLPPDVKTFLDLGCGAKPWFFDEDFKEIWLGSQAYGLDKEAFQFIPPLEIDFTFTQYELKNILPFENDKFDLVTAFALLEHLDEPEQVLKEIARVLKTGGVLLTTVPTKLAKPILEFLAFRLHLIGEESIADHKRYFDKKMLAHLLQATDFTIEKLEYFELGCNLLVKALKQ